MHTKLLILISLTLALWAKPVGAAERIVTLTGFNQLPVGEVSITPLPDRTDTATVTATVKGVSISRHELRLHETGDCSDYDSFEKAGPPVTANILLIPVDGTGSGTATAEWSGLDDARLHDENGGALVLFEQNDPTGQNAKRMACGILTPAAVGAVK